MSVSVGLLQLFNVLLILFVLDPIQLGGYIEIIVERKLVYFGAIVVVNQVVFLAACTYWFADVFALFYNTLTRFISDLQGLYLHHFRQSNDSPLYSQRMLKGK